MENEILVKSILFYNDLDESNPDVVLPTHADYLDVQLNTNKLDEVYRLRVKDNGVCFALFDTGARENGERPIKPEEISDSEYFVLMLVVSCCLDYLKGGEPERLDTYQLACIEELSTMFDWNDAGYGPETEPGERFLELADRIAHFECIG